MGNYPLLLEITNSFASVNFTNDYIEKERKTFSRKVIDKNKKKQRIVYFYVHLCIYVIMNSKSFLSDSQQKTA